MALDPRYITGFDLEQTFVDKTTGEPLAGGFLSFFKDDDRTVSKLVYQLSGAPPNYTYTALPDPITLSSVGTIQNAGGDNVALYAFPYDASGNVELYYVTCTDSLGTVQFVREAWPGSDVSGDSTRTQANISNALTNPQFAEVLFIPTATLTITISGAGTQHIAVAPGWTLNVTTTGASTVQLTRNAITGTTAYPYNPPYTLTVVPGANISAISLSQRLTNDPAIWSPQNAGSTNGYLSASILLAPLSSVTMYYAPSVGVQQTILSANNLSGLYAESTATVLLTPPTNTSGPATGYVDIIVQLPVASTVTLSNVQVVGLESNIQNVVYDQTTANRQRDYMFHYYNPLLQYKPIPSYLVGWDFALNPTQFLGPTLAASAAGANTSRYVWDQTIVFQSANSGPAISRGTNGCLTVTATNTTQFALVQYLEQKVARMILNDRNSVNIAAFTALAGGLAGTVSLWYTTDANLPSCAANNSIVATIDAFGKPATFNGTWSEVPRSNLGNARFTVGASPTTTNFNDYGFNGWDLQGIAATNTATWFAIVVGFASLTAASSVNIDSISLVAGDVPSRPSPYSGGIETHRCEQYYETCFNPGVIPGTALGASAGISSYPLAAATGGPVIGPSVAYKTSKVRTPTVTILNPINNNNQIYNTSRAADCTASAATTVSDDLFTPQCEQPFGAAAGDSLIFAWTSDARLGA